MEGRVNRLSTAERLKALIVDSDRKQAAIAQEIGISSSTLSNYVTGVSGLPGDVAAKLAVYFGVTTDYLLCLTDVPEPPFELSKEERILITKLRPLDTPDRQVVAKLIQFLKERQS